MVGVAGDTAAEMRQPWKAASLYGLPSNPSTSPMFLAAVVLHVVVGLVCVATGAAAMLSRMGDSQWTF